MPAKFMPSRLRFTPHLLTVAFAALGMPFAAHAAALDRTTQPSWGFTEDGTMAYIEHITVNPDVSGKDNAGRKIPDMTETYRFLNFGVKSDLNDRVSVGVFYDEPLGADVKYHGDNSFTGVPRNVLSNIYGQASQTLQDNGMNVTIKNATDLQNTIAGLQSQVRAGQGQLTQAKADIAAAASQLSQAQTALVADPSLATLLTPKIALLQQGIDAGNQKIQDGQAQLAKGQVAVKTLQGLQAITAPLESNTEGTRVSVSSKNLSGVVGVKLGEDKRWQVYGGPVFQKVIGELHLRGDAYSGATGYDASIPTSSEVGWLAGVGYTIPEIALKAALTYRAKIDHDMPIGENFPLAKLKGFEAAQTNKVTVKTPESVNLDFQTGINPTTLLMAKVRWEPWSDFVIRPKLYNAVSGVNLLDYDKDSWLIELGLGKKLSDKLAVSGHVLWDSGAGDPVTTLGPVNGYWGTSLGAHYALTPEWSASLGARYIWLGDAKAKIPNGQQVGEFKNNHATVYGLRLTYQKK